MLDKIMALSGLIASIWITLGVYIAAKFYPGYQHRQQFCSELGAMGSPTQKLSPRINNYPLSILFCIFGIYIMQLPNNNLALFFCGLLIVIHGIGTWVAGYFPMDKDPYTEQPSTACKVHSWAGLFMLLALLIAPLLTTFTPEQTFFPDWFRWMSLLSVVLAAYYLFKMAKAVKVKTNVGLYQRISYWVQLGWLSTLSFILSGV